MGPLVVPMDPQFLPEAALLLASIVAGALALRFLFTRERGNMMRAAAACLGCLALAFVLTRTHHEARQPVALLPAETTSSMSLLLGDVVLRVAPSERYVFSVGNEQFLVLDLHHSELRVTCAAGTNDLRAVGINANAFPSSRTGFRPSRPDPHTLLVQENGEDIFRVHYAEPRTIQVTGYFFGREPDDGALISFHEGIRWRGGSVPGGTVVDLTSQGRGRIEFDRSGSIRIRPPPDQQLSGF